MKKCLKPFNIKFTSQQISNEYNQVKIKNVLSFFNLLLGVIIAVLSSVIINSIVGKHELNLLLAIPTLIGCILLLVFSRKLKQYLGFIIFVLFCILSVGTMLSSRSFGISEFCTNSFLVGYLYGATERVVSLRLPRFEFKIIYTGVSLIGRVILFQGEVKNLIYQLILIFLSFYVDFLKEKEDRNLFKGFFDYREGLTKFKTLMVSGIPTNILILSKDLSKQLFINDPFKSLLDDVDLDRISWLRSLIIDKDSLGDGIKAYLSRQLDLFDSVESLLEILTHKKLLKEGRIYNFNAKYTNVKEKLFEIKVFSLNWDGDDAIVLILNDVTEHNMNLALKAADSNKDKMLAIVSHELRTPLNGILGMVNLLEKEIMHPQSLTYLSVCKSSGKMLLNIVNSILDLGQIRNNTLKLNITKDDLYKLLHEICYLFKFQFDFNPLSVRTKFYEKILCSPPHIEKSKNY